MGIPCASGQHAPKYLENWLPQYSNIFFKMMNLFHGFSVSSWVHTIFHCLHIKGFYVIKHIYALTNSLVIPSLIISILYYFHICLPFDLFFILDPYLTMKIMLHSRKSLFQQKFHKKLYYFNKNANLRVWCKRWFNWTSGVGQKLQIRPTPSVVRNPTPTPPKKRRLVATPTLAPQPWLQHYDFWCAASEFTLCINQSVEGKQKSH